MWIWGANKVIVNKAKATKPTWIGCASVTVRRFVVIINRGPAPLPFKPSIFLQFLFRWMTPGKQMIQWLKNKSKSIPSSLPLSFPFFLQRHVQYEGSPLKRTIVTNSNELLFNKLVFIYVFLFWKPKKEFCYEKALLFPAKC